MTIKDNKKVAKPFLKWAGSKRWLVPYLEQLYKPYKHCRYVSPFLGSGADLIACNPTLALLNDNNSYLMELYRWVKENSIFTISMKNEESFYYSARNRFNEIIKLEGIPTEHTINTERTQLFYYLNRTGFNGLCRFNKQGYYNVPFGSYKTINYPADLKDYKPLLSTCDLLSRDFEDVPILSTDFIYCDPPYDNSFTNYTSKAFTWDDQVRLVNWIINNKATTVISNLATDRILDLYSKSGLTVFDKVTVPRYISCKKDNRKPVIEVIATYNWNV